MAKKTGILLLNLGTPDHCDPRAVRRYLRQFLSDPRVVEIPRPLWWLILNGVILPLRAKKSARLYQSIWTPHGSPLLAESQQIADALHNKLQQQHVPDCQVSLAMRYGNPSIASVLADLKKNGIEKLIVLPLYPQYAAATVASCFDEVTAILRTWRAIPECHFIAGYADHPAYINAIANSIKAYQQTEDPADYFLFSFHGIPKRSIDLGDPYYQQCQISAQLIAEQLKLRQSQWQLVFQSRFGKAQWLTPYCDQTLQSLPQQGYKKVAVVCPGFAVDCLETLQEINIENRELFLESGGEQFDYIPALNHSDLQIELLFNLILADQCNFPKRPSLRTK